MTPFKLINGEPIDLKRQEHRDEIIKRNRALESAVAMGTDKFTISIRIEVELNCLKCGTRLEGYEDQDYFSFSDIDDHMPNLTCGNCGTKYTHNPEDQVYNVKLKNKNPKPFSIPQL